MLEIKVKGTQRLYRKLFTLAEKYIGGETLMRMIGEAMIDGIKDYYSYLDIVHSEYAHNFYPNEAKKFRMVLGRSKTNPSVSIRSTSANIIHKLYGGAIYPKGAEYLAIPISERAKAYKGSYRYARNALANKKAFVFKKGYELFLAERSFSIVYLLKEEVMQKPHKYVDPMNTAVGKETMYYHVNTRLAEFVRQMEAGFNR